jgi:hypothetical protein
MRMKAMIEVEFEADEQQANQEHIFEVALTRAVGHLPYIIEHGITGSSVPTGIKRGKTPSTTKVKVLKREIVPSGTAIA